MSRRTTFTSDALDAERESVSPYALQPGDVIADREHVATLSGVGIVQRIEHSYATRVHVLVPEPFGDDDVPVAFYVHSTDRVQRVIGAHVEHSPHGWSGSLRQRTIRGTSGESELYVMLRFLLCWRTIDDTPDDVDAFVRQYDETEQAWA
jgi:hypothetical protein